MFIDIYILSALVIFYIIYFGKMLIQKKKNIQTNQLGKNKNNKKLYIQELTLRMLTTIIVIIQLASIIMSWSLLNVGYRYIGLMIASTGVILFFVSIVTMSDSWRAGITDDKTKLISRGIYKISRNPAFVGFDLIYIGTLLAFFNYLLFIITIITIILLHLQILEEEKKLPTIFGEDYMKYIMKVRRYFGRK